MEFKGRFGAVSKRSIIKLGEGSEGTVVAMLDQTTGTSVAVKYMKTEARDEEVGLLERLSRTVASFFLGGEKGSG